MASKIKEAIARALADEVKPPPEVDARIKRGLAAMEDGAPKRNERLRFVRGRQYSWVDTQNTLQEQATTSEYEGRRGRARHRVRSVRNYIFDHYEAEVAGATQRVPGYDVAPTSYESRRVAAAKLARKGAYYGYEEWGVDQATERVIRLAVATGEGYAWPYFDNNIGPFHEVEKGKVVGEGDIRVRVYSPNEVFWEPGVRFRDSRWHGVVQARDVDEVMEQTGYIGGALNPDARTSSTSDSEAPQDRLVLEYHYLERPSKRNPEGRWITIANGRVIIPPRPYPCLNQENKVLDEPVLHELFYSEDPDSDRNLGPVQFAIDPQRQLNHAVSKIAEWVNLTLNPQLLVENGKVLSGKLNDVPGAIIRVVGGKAEWRVPPQIPPELFRQKEEAIQDIARMFAQNDIPSQVESGKGIQFLLEKDSARRATFYKNLARYHARLMRHCLYLMQRHYTEPRLLQIRGEDGSLEPLKDFLGAELLGEVDVRVSAGSLEPRTRESIESKILSYADRGWVSPHEAMAAINAGTAEQLVQSYEKDIARANLIIQKVKEGPEVLFNTPPRRPFFGEDPGREVSEAGEEIPREFIPGWMPRPFDNVPVQKDVISDFMKGTEYDDFEPPQQEAINAVYDSLLQLEAMHQAQEARAQLETAESLGTANAARPSSPPPMPDKAPLNAA